MAGAACLSVVVCVRPVVVVAGWGLFGWLVRPVCQLWSVSDLLLLVLRLRQRVGCGVGRPAGRSAGWLDGCIELVVSGRRHVWYPLSKSEAVLQALLGVLLVYYI